MLAPWKKSYDKPRQHIKKQRHTLPTKVHLVKPMVFLVVMYGCESWTIKKAECGRIDAFGLWHWRRKWQPTLVFLPGESQGRGNLVDCHPWGCTESDMTEATYSSSSRYYLGQSYIYTDEEAEPKK